MSPRRPILRAILVSIVLGCGSGSSAQPPGNVSPIDGKDGLEYVWIPPGSFTMGCVEGDARCLKEETPRHLVTLTRGFWLGRTEVTVGAYRRVASALGKQMPKAPHFNPAWRDEDHPIVNVSWHDAAAYCEFVGGRLPTEAEWEYAARGGKGGLKYPWGNTMGREHANYGKDTCCGGLAEGRDRWEFTSPAASFGVNGFGVHDMAGNVWEWCADRFGKYPEPPSIDPRGASSEEARILRGGSWLFSPFEARLSGRRWVEPGFTSVNDGFRCVLDAPAAQQPAKVTPAAAAGITPELVTRLVQQSPAFAAGAGSTPEVGQLLPIPRSPALYAQISWEEEGRRRAAIVTVGPLNAAPGASFLVELDGVGLLHLVDDLTLDEVVTALDTALNVGRQRRTMGYMRNVATANDTMRVDTGRYAASLSELAGTYMQRVQETDGWGNPWVYVAQGGNYSLASRGSDGVPGPLPPDEWPGEPFEPDLLVVNGELVHWPWPLTEIPEGDRLERRLFEPWRVVYRRQVERQERTVSLMRMIVAANETRRAETGAYAADLEDLRTGFYAPLNIAVDAWGNPFMYQIAGSSYMLVSLGCDGAPGPAPPEPWEGMPCEPDIIVFDRRFSQAPAGR